MIKFLKNIIKKFLPLKYILIYGFKRNLGYKPSIKNPTTWNEKILWIKLYERNKIYTTLSDKLKVRDFIANTIGKDSLIPLYGVYDKFLYINLDKIEDNQFVIKCNHDSGSTMILDKTTFKSNKKYLNEKYSQLLHQNYYYKNYEWQYKNIKPVILIEKKIGDNINDYKFFCFNGEPLYIQVDGDRFNKHKRDIYDINWNKIDVKLMHDNFKDPITRPEKLGEMIEIARKISKQFYFVRIDLYDVDNTVYFGEITFTHGAGYEYFDKEEWNIKFGELIHLPFEHE